MDRDILLGALAGIILGASGYFTFNHFYHYKYILPLHSNLILEQRNAPDFAWHFWRTTDGNCILNEHKQDGDHMTVWRCSYDQSGSVD